MKKALVLFIAIILLLSYQALAADGPVKKLGRGVANVATCPLELPKGMGDANAESGIFAGMTWGVLKGAFDTVKRCAVGVYEVATFPVPIPADYKPILDEPEFFMEDTDHSGAIEKDWSYE